MAYVILNKQLMQPVRAVLFDMDGLVLDSEILYTRFWREAVEELGFSMSREQALGMRSLSREHGQEYLCRCFGPGIDYTRAKAIRIRRMDAWIAEHGVSPKPGIYELLDYLREKNIPCAITTSSPLQRIKDHLSPLGLYDKFDAVCSGYEVKHGKPAPDIYLYGASKLSVSPSDCLALEDSPAGLESAWRAGCLTGLVPDLDRPGQETLNKTFVLADSLSDICGLIDTLNFHKTVPSGFAAV